MAGAQFQALLAGKKFLPGTPVQTGQVTTTTGFAATLVIFDRTIAITNSSYIYSLGGFWANAIANASYFIALENSSTSMTTVVEVAHAHPGGNVWDDVIIPTPYLVPSTGTYRLGFFGTIGTDDFNSTGTRTSKVSASDPGLATITGLSNATDGTINLRYTPAI